MQTSPKLSPLNKAPNEPKEPTLRVVTLTGDAHTSLLRRVFAALSPALRLSSRGFADAREQQRFQRELDGRQAARYDFPSF